MHYVCLCAWCVWRRCSSDSAARSLSAGVFSSWGVFLSFFLLRFFPSFSFLVLCVDMQRIQGRSSWQSFLRMSVRRRRKKKKKGKKNWKRSTHSPKKPQCDLVLVFLSLSLLLHLQGFFFSLGDNTSLQSILFLLHRLFFSYQTSFWSFLYPWTLFPAIRERERESWSWGLVACNRSWARERRFFGCMYTRDLYTCRHGASNV